MERDERYEINSKGELVIGTPIMLTSAEKKEMIEKMFSINGWEYTILEEISSSHYFIQLKNNNLNTIKKFHLYHGNVRKEDPERNREEKKIQLGTDNDPRNYMDKAIILGFYVFEDKYSLNDLMVVAWPIESGKNYPANPSLRVNIKTDILVAKNTGFYTDSITGKKLVVFKPEFIYHYIENYKELQYPVTNQNIVGHYQDKLINELQIDCSTRLATGENILLYGVPGSGKSWIIEHEYCKNENHMERLVFHPDYMYSDFVGQILPKVVKGEDGTDKVRYEFTPGPFTKIIKRAYQDPINSYFLVIEEINRGNAPAIFGEIFQLLDRVNEDKFFDDNLLFRKCTSEYGITNANVAEVVYGDENRKIRIPSNLSIIGTMNTSDQNVFTLDTAFQRRWIMRMIPNSFKNHIFAENVILDTGISWRQFCEAINGEILRKNNIMSSEDKRLGAYFVCADDLSLIDVQATASLEEQKRAERHNSHFAEKVLKYLWDDAFKFSQAETFNNKKYKSLEMVIDGFMSTSGVDRFRIFNKNLRSMIINGFSEDNNIVYEAEE